MDKNSPLISVLMPAYDAAKFIKKAIESILNQTYLNIELLIADDGSKDATKKIIDSYNDDRIKCFHNNKNIGYLKTCNKLFSLAEGSYITFQDSDDWSAKDRIEKQLNFLSNNPDLSGCGSNIYYVDVYGNQTKKTNFATSYRTILDEMPKKYNVIGATVFIKSDVIKTVGGYNDFFDRMGCEDHYWIYKILEKYNFENIPERLYYYRFNPISVSGNLSNNPYKILAPKVVEFLINQRKEGKMDLLEENPKKMRTMVDSWVSPFKRDKSYFLYYLSKRRFYEGRKNQAIKYIARAILKKPAQWGRYRDLLYFLRNYYAK